MSGRVPRCGAGESWVRQERCVLRSDTDQRLDDLGDGVPVLKKEISHTPHRLRPDRRLMSAKQRREETAAQRQAWATLPASVQPTSALACPCPMPCSDFKYPTITVCFSRLQLAMICCHSAIERPYFFWMDGEYDAGPCFGQGGSCSVMLTYSLCWPGSDETNRGALSHRPDDRLMPRGPRRPHLVIPAIPAAEQQFAVHRSTSAASSHLATPRKQHQASTVLAPTVAWFANSPTTVSTVIPWWPWR